MNIIAHANTLNYQQVIELLPSLREVGVSTLHVASPVCSTVTSEGKSLPLHPFVLHDAEGLESLQNATEGMTVVYDVSIDAYGTKTVSTKNKSITGEVDEEHQHVFTKKDFTAKRRRFLGIPLSRRPANTVPRFVDLQSEHVLDVSQEALAFLKGKNIENVCVAVHDEDNAETVNDLVGDSGLNQVTWSSVVFSVDGNDLHFGVGVVETTDEETEETSISFDERTQYLVNFMKKKGQFSILYQDDFCSVVAKGNEIKMVNNGVKHYVFHEKFPKVNTIRAKKIRDSDGVSNRITRHGCFWKTVDLESGGVKTYVIEN